MVAKKALPWRKSNPKKQSKRKHLTNAETAEARKRAAKAGRPYPNLVDNMAVARKKKSK